MLSRVTLGFNAEATRLANLGEDVKDAIRAFADEADVRQQQLCLRLLRKVGHPTASATIDKGAAS
ncbi:hypothetical protein [Bradyrhizobium sp. SZCCHNS3051]|uniref:hypothetical protein n=1 Tax=Bradyrhizobium sp. SZCCHNS3051 TaxID=3057320 RepID=UPI002915FC5F|nr:hypothetical protein [Bradyrhizobium sp. SZCCHNS3051]